MGTPSNALTSTPPETLWLKPMSPAWEALPLIYPLIPFMYWKMMGISDNQDFEVANQITPIIWHNMSWCYEEAMKPIRKRPLLLESYAFTLQSNLTLWRAGRVPRHGITGVANLPTKDVVWLLAGFEPRSFGLQSWCSNRWASHTPQYISTTYFIYINAHI